MATATKTRNSKTATDGDDTAVVPPVQQVSLKRLTTNRLLIPVSGVSPLIVNRWSEKAKQLILDAQQGKTKTKAERRPIRDPEQDYKDSLYVLEDGRYGLPASAFKSAIINAISQFGGLTKVLGKQSIFLFGEGAEQLVPIIGEPQMREDMVRVGQGTADLRYRGQFWPWSAILDVQFVDSAMSKEAVLALVDAAGLGGVGEWRPSAPRSASGSFGMFNLADENDIIEVESKR